MLFFKCLNARIYLFIFQGTEIRTVFLHSMSESRRSKQCLQVCWAAVHRPNLMIYEPFLKNNIHGIPIIASKIRKPIPVNLAMNNWYEKVEIQVNAQQEIRTCLVSTSVKLKALYSRILLHHIRKSVF